MSNFVRFEGLTTVKTSMFSSGLWRHVDLQVLNQHLAETNSLDLRG